MSWSAAEPEWKTVRKAQKGKGQSHITYAFLVYHNVSSNWKKLSMLRANSLGKCRVQISRDGHYHELAFCNKNQADFYFIILFQLKKSDPWMSPALTSGSHHISTADGHRESSELARTSKTTSASLSEPQCQCSDKKLSPRPLLFKMSPYRERCSFNFVWIHWGKAVEVFCFSVFFFLGEGVFFFFFLAFWVFSVLNKEVFFIYVA